MTDRDTGNQGEAKPFGQELVSFVEGLRFGTPEFRAVSDYFQEQKLYREMALHRNNSLSRGNDRAQTGYWESEERISEAKIALLQHQIYQNETQLEGYSKTYYHFKSMLESDLALASNNEANKKFPNDEASNSAYAKQVYNLVEGRLENQIARIMEGSKPTE
jgi:hypothetical protein